MEDQCNLLLETENQQKIFHEKLSLSSKITDQLQDLNLDLEVDNFNFAQDLAVLDSRLAKYQHLLKTKEECVVALKADMNQVKVEHENVIGFLKVEMSTFGNQLHNLQQLLVINAEPLQEENRNLHSQIDMLQSRCDTIEQLLIQEREMNQASAVQIIQLQKSVSQKIFDVNKFFDIQKQFEASVHHCRDLEEIIAKLQRQIEDFDCEHLVNDQIREKLQVLMKLLDQKNQQLSMSRSELFAQVKLWESLKEEYEVNVKCYETTITDYNDLFAMFKEKLTKIEADHHDMTVEFKKIQIKLLESAQKLSHKDQEQMDEEMRLNAIITNLQLESTMLKEELVTNEQALQAVRSEKKLELTILREDLAMVKTQFDALSKLKNVLKTENENLHLLMPQLLEGTSALEEQNKNILQEYDQCLIELQTVFMDKVTLEAANKELSQELCFLQNSFGSLTREYQFKSESVMNLEIELREAKSSHDLLCQESKIVVGNVRIWLQEQRQINDELAAAVQNNVAMIKKLKREKLVLQAKLRTSEKCRRKSKLIVRNRSVRSPVKSSWNLESQESDSMDGDGSLTGGFNNNQGWCSYGESDENSDETESVSSLWLRNIENVTEGLQRSNQYWRIRMSDLDCMVTRDK